MAYTTYAILLIYDIWYIHIDMYLINNEYCSMICLMCFKIIFLIFKIYCLYVIFTICVRLIDIYIYIYTMLFVIYTIFIKKVYAHILFHIY